MEYKEISKEELNKLKDNEEYAIIISKGMHLLELEKAKEQYEKLILFTKEHNLKKAYSWFHYYLAWVYYDMLDLEKSIELHKEGIKLFKELDHIPGILASINGLFGCYISLQMFDTAIELGMEGLELARKSNNEEMLGIIKSNILAIYVEIEEYEKGIDVYEEIVKSTCVYDRNNEIINLLNRGICEFGVNHIENAKRYLKKAYENAIETSSYLLPGILAEAAIIYIQLKAFDIAMNKLEEAYSYIREDTTSEVYIKVLEVHGDLELERKNYKVALEKYKKVYESIYDRKWRKKLKEICKKLSRVYQELEDYKTANYYLRKYIEKDEEIRQMRSNDKVKVLNDKKEEEEEKAYKVLYSQTEKLYQFGQMITSNLQKEDILKTIAKEIKEIMDYDVVQIVLYKEEEEVFEYQLFLQDGKEIHNDPIPLSNESFAGYCIKNKKEILIKDINDEFYRYINWDKYIKETVLSNEVDCSSAIFVPIIVRDKGIGVISVQSYQRNQYDAKDVSTMRIMCSFVAIALENARLYKRVQYLATYDDLTKLFNKREVMKRGEELYQNINQSQKRAIIMIDIDNFKAINDKYGHIMGDQVIQQVAMTLKDHIQKEDIIGRYGGEEFIVFLSYGQLKRCQEVAELLRESVEKIALISKQGMIHVTISVGVAITKAGDTSLYQLIGYADNELYKAKRNGKNRVSIGTDEG